MTAGGHKPPSRGRSVTSEEAELWNYATRSLARVKAKERVKAQAPSVAEPPLRTSAVAKSRELSADKLRPTAPVQTPPPPARTAPQPLADFDRRKARRIAAGRSGIDAHIDLHGERLKDARARLTAFLYDAQAKGLKTVLVVTGKGDAQDRSDYLAHALGEPRRGVLRRNVPHWLEQPDLRAIVLSYTSASPRHGGAGALYVQLRKSMRTRD